MRHAIIACSDQKCEDFLIHDWMRSLVDNVNRDNIDVIIIDYGLSNDARAMLAQLGAITHSLPKDGAVSTQRMKDIARIIRPSNYDQIMVCDAGDLIFQEDISHLFEQNKDAFRAACEGMAQPFGVYMKASMVSSDVYKIKRVIKGKRMINSGVMIAPREKLLALLEESDAMIKKNVWGAEQPVINYVFYRDGFVELPCGYNFAIATSTTPFYIEQSQFFFKDGVLIPIVHNIGRKNFLRPVSNFGYGAGKNRIKPMRYHLLRAIFMLTHLLYYILD